jgi:hypothetical protein
LTGWPSHLIFEKGLLDVETVYERAGWKVTYDKPAYNETYPATFRFVALQRKEKK